jgi:hypothetical protein
MSPAIGSPASMRTVELIGNKVLQVLGPCRVKVSTCGAPVASQQVSWSHAGLLRMTLSA